MDVIPPRRTHRRATRVRVNCPYCWYCMSRPVAGRAGRSEWQAQCPKWNPTDELRCLTWNVTIAVWLPVRPWPTCRYAAVGGVGSARATAIGGRSQASRGAASQRCM